MNKNIRKLSLLAAYLVFLFLFFEISSQIVLLFCLPKLNLECDSWWRNFWIKRKSVDAGIEILYQTDIYDPTKGWRMKKNLKNIRLYDNKWTISTNSKGLRGNSEYNYDKRKGAARIVVLGDSFTFGDEVSDNETYPYYLQKLLPGSEVLNFGVHGYGHDQMLICLKEEGIKYKPDVVILGFIYRDMPRNMLKFRDYAKPRFVLIKGRLFLQNSPVPAPEQTLKNEIYRPKFIDLLSIIQQTCFWRYGINEKRMKKISDALLDELTKAARSAGAIPVFVYIPEPAYLRQKDTEEKREGFFIDYCANRKVPCVSLLPVFRKQIEQGAYVQKEGHWKAAGQKIIAEEVYRYLVKNKYCRN